MTYVIEKISGPGNFFIDNEQATQLTKGQFLTIDRIKSEPPRGRQIDNFSCFQIL